MRQMFTRGRCERLQYNGYALWRHNNHKTYAYWLCTNSNWFVFESIFGQEFFLCSVLWSVCFWKRQQTTDQVKRAISRLIGTVPYAIARRWGRQVSRRVRGGKRDLSKAIKDLYFSHVSTRATASKPKLLPLSPWCRTLASYTFFLSLKQKQLNEYQWMGSKKCPMSPLEHVYKEHRPHWSPLYGVFNG